MNDHNPAAAKRILLVDDQSEVRETIKMVLEFGGHSVKEAAGGQQALEAFQGTEFDLVITDYAMPGLRGDQLAERIKQAKPSQLILMVSGSVECSNPAEMSADAMLRKPFRMEELLQAVSGLVAPSQLTLCD